MADVNMIKHRFKDFRTIEEEAAREDFLGNFEAELDDLLGKGATMADEIGGSFRSPGLKMELRNLVRAKLQEILD